MGGIGKTALAVKIAQKLQNQFEYVIWRSLRNAPPLETLLSELVPFLSEQEETEAKLSKLLQCLRFSRCLVILDNMEAILQAGEEGGKYRPGYEDYSELLRLVGETAHQSCFILTSREKPAELATSEGIYLSARSLHLSGSEEVSFALIQASGLVGSQKQQQKLCDRYSCNPLALKIVATSIQDLFDGDIGEFLAQDTAVFNGIQKLLDQQFNRLSPLEQTIMYWLGINREWTGISELAGDIVPTVSKPKLLEALESLSWRSLIEKQIGSYTQQPVVMEYVTERLIEQVTREIIAQTRENSPPCHSAPLLLFHSHPLLKTTVKDFVRETQVRLILQPTLDKLLAIFGHSKGVKNYLAQILERLRGKFFPKTGYAGGNILNLLCQLQVDLSGYDFSHLTVWQAYLQETTLHKVNFAHCDLAKSVFTQNFGSILSVAFSPDGKLLAAGDSKGSIRLWRAEDGQPLLTCKGHRNWICSVMFSPDGQFLASGSADGTVKLWNITQGQCLNTWQEHGGWVWSVAFSPDSCLVVSGSEDHTVRLWEIKSGRCLNTLLGHTEGVRSVAFSPKHQTIVSGSGDRTLKLWEVHSGRCRQTFTGHTNWVWTVAFSPDGRYLASGSEDKTIKLWNVSSGQCLNTLQGHTSTVWSIGFSPNGKMLASGSNDRTIKLWELDDGQYLQTLTGHDHLVSSVAFSPDSFLLASGSQDRTVKLWDISNRKCLKTLSGYINTVRSVAFSPTQDSLSCCAKNSERKLASGSDDKTVRLWNLNDGQCLNLRGHKGLVISVAFSPNGQTLASGSEDQTVKIWHVDKGECLNTLQGHTSRIWTVAFSPDSHLLASGSADRTVKLWSASKGQHLNTLHEHTNWILAVAFSPDSNLLASSSLDHMVKIWDVKQGKCLKTLRGHTNGVWSVAFSPDGQLLASCSADQTVKLWELSSGKCLSTLQGHSNWVWSVAFSPDGQLLASCGADQTVKLWDIGSGKCLSTLKGHTQGLWTVAFSPDGQLLASGGEDETINLWDVRAEKCLKTLQVPKAYEGMNITKVRGLTEAQKATLKDLGAVE